MISCIRCGNQDGPWTYKKGEGFVCDNCLDKEDKNNDRKGESEKEQSTKE